ncbi:UDP-3-O-(3-hydroxymyristoyl)glucosamine N-acyltransferase [Terriglobus roseus]|uniref:UDP-3-O-[3-hydroxymyristoyl] glucosamine N-acyltransferase n=1 Tax=Terriglobus roseus TaxID=392734 RepID=A0A1H4JIL0_9BACT|nr:UDP-3-O-(3-hydroxymyristoyl)glucosamine N-acyltransferase [Terriglobus roseus]SEB46007.1 UDP-3-O-[3-hydroxymyristoyl] glucosamine N-acyltransferase [Terriglobus roseus]
MATRPEIAAWLGAEIGRATSAEILRVAAPESASADAVVFATSAEALASALASAAGLVLASAKLASDDPRVMHVADARLAFSVVADRLRPRVSAQIDPTAQIAPSTKLSDGVSVGPGTVVGEAVTIGTGCTIGARVVIEAGVVLGDRVQVQAGAVLGSRGFGYARRPDGSYLLFPQQGALVIEDDVEIGANTTIDRGALGETRIGAGTKIDNLVHIGHNVRIGRNVIIAAQTGISGSSVVEDGAILGGQVGMGEHAIVGPGVILGGGAGVLSNKKLYGAGQVFWGRPARPLKQYLRDLARLSRGK